MKHLLIAILSLLTFQAIGPDGRFTMPGQINDETGHPTVNSSAGRFTYQEYEEAIIVYDNHVTVRSSILLTPIGFDPSMKSATAEPHNGYFIVYPDNPPINTRPVSFLVITLQEP